MTDETEDEDLIEVAEPRGIIFDIPDGQIAIPDLDALADVLGETPLAFWAHEKGLLWLTPKRRWESLELDSRPQPVSRKN